MKKRLLAMLLVFVMAASLMSITAYADKSSDTTVTVDAGLLHNDFNVNVHVTVVGLPEDSEFAASDFVNIGKAYENVGAIIPTVFDFELSAKPGAVITSVTVDGKKMQPTGSKNKWYYTDTVGKKEYKNVNVILEHSCEYGEPVVVEPTCTVDGSSTVSCIYCGHEEVTVLPAAGHKEVEIPAVPATCEKDGATAGTKCSVCNEVITEPEVVAALGHDFGEWTLGKDDIHERACQREGCDMVEYHEAHLVPVTGKDANCTESGLTDGEKCDVEGCTIVTKEQEIIDAKGHTEVVDKAVEATCTEDGLTEGKHCSVCGEVIVAQEVVKAKGHTEVVDEAVAPTCTEDGKTEGKHCSVCDEVLVAQEKVDALGHKWGEWKDAKDGKHHSRTCENDPKHVDTEKHDFGKWVVTKEATQTEDGSKYRVCDVCGYKETAKIPAGNTKPTTGDTNDVMLYVLLSLTAVTGVVVTAGYAKKKAE